MAVVSLQVYPAVVKLLSDPQLKELGVPIGRRAVLRERCLKAAQSELVILDYQGIMNIDGDISWCIC